LRDKRITSPEQPVRTTRRELGKPIDLDTVKSSLTESFESPLEVKLTGGELTDFQLALARRLREKYASGSHIFMR
jgi:lipoate-protein ligase A